MRFARAEVEVHRSRRGAERWSPADTVALMKAVEPWGSPEPAGAVTVHDRRIDILWPLPEEPSHATLVRAGRLVAVLDVALRAMGRVPRVHIGDAAGAASLVSIGAHERHAATTRDLARRRAAHRLVTRDGRRAGRVDARALVRVVQGAQAGEGQLRLLNGATRDGLPAWTPPGAEPDVTGGLDLPWVDDPVLAVRAPGGVRGAILGGLVGHRTCIEAVLHGYRATLHPLADVEPCPRADEEDGASPPVHALVHVHP